MTMMHKVAAALAARGIDVAAVRRLPSGVPAEIAREVGCTEATLGPRITQLRKAGGDPNRAVAMHKAQYREWRGRRRADPDHQAIVAVDRAINSAKQRGVPHDPRAALLEHAERMLSLGTCPLTGIEFTPEWDGLGWSPPWRLSLDQIVPGLGETVTNTRGVVFAANAMLGQLPDPLVASYCRRWLRWNGSEDTKNGERLLAWRGRRGSAAATVLCHPRRRDCTITEDWVNERLARGVCSVTGLPLTMDPAPDVWQYDPLRPSIDRIDCTVSYHPHNCRMVCDWYNRARLDWPDSIPRRVAEGIC